MDKNCRHYGMNSVSGGGEPTGDGGRSNNDNHSHYQGDNAPTSPESSSSNHRPSYSRNQQQQCRDDASHPIQSAPQNSASSIGSGTDNVPVTGSSSGTAGKGNSDKTERKRQREQQRRRELAEGFDELSGLLTQIEQRHNSDISLSDDDGRDGGDHANAKALSQLQSSSSAATMPLSPTADALDISGSSVKRRRRAFSTCGEDDGDGGAGGGGSGNTRLDLIHRTMNSLRKFQRDIALLQRRNFELEHQNSAAVSMQSMQPCNTNAGDGGSTDDDGRSVFVLVPTNVRVSDTPAGACRNDANASVDNRRNSGSNKTDINNNTKNTTVLPAPSQPTVISLIPSTKTSSSAPEVTRPESTESSHKSASSLPTAAAIPRQKETLVPPPQQHHTSSRPPEQSYYPQPNPHPHQPHHSQSPPPHPSVPLHPSISSHPSVPPHSSPYLSAPPHPSTHGYHHPHPSHQPQHHARHPYDTQPSPPPMQHVPQQQQLPHYPPNTSMSPHAQPQHHPMYGNSRPPPSSYYSSAPAAAPLPHPGYGPPSPYHSGSWGPGGPSATGPPQPQHPSYPPRCCDNNMEVVQYHESHY